MTAYVVGRMHVRNRDKWEQYLAQVGATFAPYQGEVVLRGRDAVNLDGVDAHELAVVVRFPDLAAAERWRQSPEYRRIVPLRDEAADVVLIAYSA
ncbi:MAG: DUF1330 domain-containing protein [Betaproteobacteria bacterium]|nr:DUF1330 domain-containing protein [Betaproteobacteria bacterium]